MELLREAKAKKGRDGNDSDSSNHLTRLFVVARAMTPLDVERATVLLREAERLTSGNLYYDDQGARRMMVQWLLVPSDARRALSFERWNQSEDA